MDALKPASRFRIDTLQKAVSDNGVSVGSHSIDALHYRGRGLDFLVESGFDDACTMVVYRPVLSEFPAGVSRDMIYEDILSAARVLNHGRARWGDAPPPN